MLERADWLLGDEGAAAAVRALDWSATPLGPREHWPQGLRSVVRTTLAMLSPAAVLCGERLLLVYNDAFARLLGVRHPGALGRPAAEAWPGEWELARPACEAALYRGESACLEDQPFGFVRHGGREQASFTVAYGPVYGDDGGPIGVLATFSDATARAAAVAGKDRDDFVAAVLDTAASLIVVLDRRGRVVRFNRAAEAATGFLESEVLGRSYSMFVPPEELPSVRPVFQKLTMGDFPSQHENHWLAKDGTRRLFAWSNTAIPDAAGRPQYVVAIGTDVTERRRAEADLRYAAELLDLGDALLEVDRGWRVVRCNANQEALSRIPRAQSLGRTIWELWPEIATPASAYWREYHRCMDERVAVQFDAYFEPLDLWTGVTAYPTSTGGLVIFFRDVSARKLAEAAQRASDERFRAFAETIPQLAFIADAAGAVNYRNGRFLEYFGSDAPAAQGSSPHTLPPPHPHDVARTVEAWGAGIERGAAFRLEYRLRRQDGQYRWHVTQVTPVRDEAGRVAMWVGTSTDVHEQRQAAATLERANEQLREADRRKNEFLAVLSHELRNPLAPIRNSLYVLERAAPGGQQATRAVEVIDRQVRHMTRLVEDILDLVRISRGKVRLQLERLELCALVQRTAEDHRSLFSRNGVLLRVSTCDEPLFADGDPTRLSQAIGNLLANAAKFTPRGGAVTLSLSGDAAQAAIRVEDTGAGIAPHVLEQLFEPFTQAEQTLDRSEGGLGLGLALVKALVEMHGGSVAVDSEGPGRGTTFTLRLPRTAAGHGPEPRPEASVRAQARRVLVIEDNPDAAASLKEALELDGHEVELAASGPQGLEAARRARPEVVVCDLGLPGMDGYEVARRLRADDELGAVALVALSGYALPEDVERSRLAGFDAHLAKPADPAALARALAELPGRRPF